MPGRIVAVNNSWEIRRDADVLCFCDKAWFAKRQPKSVDLADYPNNGAAIKEHFLGRVVSLSDIEDKRVFNLRNAGHNIPLSTQQNALAHGSNSGYQAINLAFLFGAKRIVLLGFDMKTDGAQTHWHAGHRHPGNETVEQYQARMQHAFEKRFMPRFDLMAAPLAAAGVKVLNASLGSALKTWPIVPLSDVLAAKGDYF